MLNRIGLMQGRLSKPMNGLIQSFPLKTWNKEFSLARKLSIKFIEWTLDYKNLHQNPLMKKSGRKKIMKLCNRYNIKIKSITGDCFMQRPFWKENYIKIREKLLNDLNKILVCASKLKIKNIIIPLVDNGSIKNLQEEKLLIKELRRFSTFLKKKKMTILFETDFLPKKNLSFIEKFEKKNFGINYDIGNSASLNFKPKEEFKTFGKYIKNVHVKDRLKYGKTVPLGKGNANFKLISNLLKKNNFKGNLILQAARGKTGKEFETVSNYLKFLKNSF